MGEVVIVKVSVCSYRPMTTIDWPKRDDSMIEVVGQQSMERLLNMYELSKNIHTTKVNLLFKNYTESGDADKAIYELNYTLNVGNLSDDKMMVWRKLQYELEYNYTIYFFENVKNETKSNLQYGVCNKPKYLRTETPCVYKPSYLFNVKIGGYDTIFPLQTKTVEGFDIRFRIECDNSNFFTLYGNFIDGNITVSRTRSTKYATCNVICKVFKYDDDIYKNGYTSFVTKVTDIYPTYNYINSYFPVSVFYGNKFSILIKVDFPTSANSKGYSARIEFRDVGNCNISQNYYNVDIDEITTSFKFDNITINCSSHNYVYVNTYHHT